MKNTPRSLSGGDLARILQKAGYTVTQKTEGHFRLFKNSYLHHKLTVPNHDPLGSGLLNAIVEDLAKNMEIPEEEVRRRLSE